ncbi:hypothetical protein V494_01269 [Pseudogymnoascus sp. VKM F-4513 (FW-928)]|nr:hypothetical protein V494_01269 [Pseudogymnoascus sp. VKM F-4513 (FW-928)]
MADLEKSPVTAADSVEASSPTSSDTLSVGSINVPVLTPFQYRKLIWKLDLHLLPPLWALWFCSLIDRVNIGNAKIQGLEKDLHMNPKSNQFNVALVVIFIGLVGFEVPSNYIMKRVSPRAVLCTETLLLGIFTIGQGVITNWGGLVAMRFFVGIFEAGLIPGSVLLLSQYYPRYELQWRLNMLMVGNAISSAFGGLLALAIAGIHSSNGYSSWRWIFIVEGSMTAGCTLVAYFLMSDWPKTAKWLSDTERAILKAKIRGEGTIGTMDRLDSKAMRRILLDWKIWTCTLMFICSIVAVYSINLFAPTIVKQFDPDASVRHIQALVIPIFIASAAATLAVSYASDKLKHRYGFAMFGWLLTLIGLVIMINQRSVSVKARYAALYLISIGGYISVPQLWTLLVNNCSGSYKIAFAVGFEMGLGNMGGIISSLTFQGSQGPFYDMGYRVNLGLVCAAMVLATGYVGGMWWENKQRDQGKRNHLLEGEEKDNLGDDHPLFRYGF